MQPLVEASLGLCLPVTNCALAGNTDSCMCSSDSSAPGSPLLFCSQLGLRFLRM